MTLILKLLPVFIICTACQHYSIDNQNIKQIKFDIDSSGWRPKTFRIIYNKDSIQQLIDNLNENRKINSNWFKWHPLCRVIFVYPDKQDTIFGGDDHFRKGKDDGYHDTYHLSDTTSIYNQLLKDAIKKY
jgi:hypothetical protein